MSTSTTYPFTTASNYTASDADAIGVTGGVGILTLSYPAGLGFEAPYDTDIDADYVAGGSGTGTATGTAAVSAGKLDLTGGINYVDYNSSGNADTAVQTGCIRYRVTPNYSGNPAARRVHIATSDTTASNNNHIYIYHESTGSFRTEFYNSAGSSIFNVTWAAWNPTAGTTYEIEFNWDITTGASRMFIDGTQLGSTNVSTGTRTGDAHLLRIGANNAVSPTLQSDSKFEDLQIYSAVQHTANYTPGYTVGGSYSTGGKSLLTNTGVAGRIRSMAASTTITGSDTIKYTLRYGGTDYYWTGSAWASSSGAGQANTIDELTTEVLAQLDTGKSSVAFKVWLMSDDGTTTPSIDSLTVTYDAYDSSATEPTLVFLEGYLYDHNGPYASQTVEIRSVNGHVASEIFVVREWVTLDTTDSSGYFSGYVWASPGTKDYEIRIGTNRYVTTIPNQSSVSFSDLTLTRQE